MRKFVAWMADRYRTTGDDADRVVVPGPLASRVTSVGPDAARYTTQPRSATYRYGDTGTGMRRLRVTSRRTNPCVGHLRRHLICATSST